MEEIKPAVEIIELYKNYTPPIAVIPVTRKLLDNIPQKYLMGLRRIVITNSSGLPRNELRKKVKSRKKKFSASEVRGFYHQQTGDSSAWIEVFVDKITGYEIGLYRKIPLLREMAFAEVLYHEVGHHIHKVLKREHREQEDIADEWEGKLLALYVREKYWYILPFLRLVTKLTQTKLYQGYERKMMEEVKRRSQSS